MCVGRGEGGRLFPEETAACGGAGDLERTAVLGATPPPPGGKASWDITAVWCAGLRVGLRPGITGDRGGGGLATPQPLLADRRRGGVRERRLGARLSSPADLGKSFDLQASALICKTRMFLLRRGGGLRVRPGKILTPNGFPCVICRQRSLLMELEN